MTKIELLEKAKPILFNTEMVRAIQDGRKTVTRRVIKLKYGNTHIQWHKDKYGKCLVEMQNDVEGETYGVREDGTHWQKILAMREIKSPYKVGDILYVRETWCKGNFRGEEERYYYRADNKVPHCEWHPSIHMPKEAARIFLRVMGVRAERLQNSFFKSGSTIFTLLGEGVDIGEQCRECIDTYGSPCCIDDESECGTLDKVRSDYSDLWNSTIKKSDLAKYGWSANPWVWVIEFERVGGHYDKRRISGNA